jgi:hypothetical protein
MRNTVHGAGGFFEQRNLNLNKKSINNQFNGNLIDKFNPANPLQQYPIHKTKSKASPDQRRIQFT